MTLTLYDRICGCIYGGAIGDAMGYPVEFSSMEAIHGRYGEAGVQEPPKPALYTDDTQMTLRVAQGLLQALDETKDGILDMDAADEFVAKQLILWRKEDPPRAPGSSCLHGVANLEKGVEYSEAGKPDSKGCGAVMRSAPYGLIGLDLPSSADLAAEHALMTHLHPAAQASAAALAAGVACLLLDPTVEVAVDVMETEAKRFDQRTASMIRWASSFAKSQEVSSESVLREWQGWTGDEAIAASVYCFVKHQDDFSAALRLAVNSPGDSDSLGAITGNLIGAYLGVTSIPQQWLDNIENAGHIKSICDRLLKQRERT